MMLSVNSSNWFDLQCNQYHHFFTEQALVNSVGLDQVAYEKQFYEGLHNLLFPLGLLETIL